jgi:hypothetical protein
MSRRLVWWLILNNRLLFQLCKAVEASCGNPKCGTINGSLEHERTTSLSLKRPKSLTVERAFGSEIDYAMLVKLYENDSQAETRYSPAECMGCHSVGITGRPDPIHISTSFVERQNLTLRMSMRRFTRLTNGFSKKVENHAWMLAIHYMPYNFCRIHKTLRVTPAMAAGVSDHVWSLEKIVLLAR